MCPTFLVVMLFPSIGTIITLLGLIFQCLPLATWLGGIKKRPHGAGVLGD